MKPEVFISKETEMLRKVEPQLSENQFEELLHRRDKAMHKEDWMLYFALDALVAYELGLLLSVEEGLKRSLAAAKKELPN